MTPEAFLKNWEGLKRKFPRIASAIDAQYCVWDWDRKHHKFVFNERILKNEELMKELIQLISILP